jgi:hypothetical protein
MKKGYVTVLFALFCVLGLGSNARAQQAEDTIIAKVPHEFVAGGVALPAGTYMVSRLDSAGGLRELKISNRETYASVYLIPTIFDDTQSGQSQISFIRLGDNYFLSSIQTPIGTYATHIPRSAIALAQTKDHGTVSSSGTN